VIGLYLAPFEVEESSHFPIRSRMTMSWLNLLPLSCQ
jgi:hypothetical protein